MKYPLRNCPLTIRRQPSRRPEHGCGDGQRRPGGRAAAALPRRRTPRSMSLRTWPSRPTGRRVDSTPDAMQAGPAHLYVRAGGEAAPLLRQDMHEHGSRVALARRNAFGVDGIRSWPGWDPRLPARGPRVILPAAMSRSALLPETVQRFSRASMHRCPVEDAPSPLQEPLVSPGRAQGSQRWLARPRSSGRSCARCR